MKLSHFSFLYSCINFYFLLTIFNIFVSLVGKVGVCGAHLYQEMCLAHGQKLAKKEEAQQKPPLLLKFLTHPYTPSLATTIAISLLTDIREWICSRLAGGWDFLSFLTWCFSFSPHWLGFQFAVMQQRNFLDLVLLCSASLLESIIMRSS